jgi:hypothetical protein
VNIDVDYATRWERVKLRDANRGLELTEKLFTINNNIPLNFAGMSNTHTIHASHLSQGELHGIINKYLIDWNIYDKCGNN